MQAPAENDGQMQSETVEELLDQVAKLESRIFGSQLPSDRFISPDSMQQILRRVGANCNAAGPSGQSAAQRLDLSSEVKRVIESEPETIQPNRRLSKRHTALLQIVEYLFYYLEYAADLDPAAYAAIQDLQVGLAQILIVDSGALNQAEHPARRFLELLVSTCKGYDRYAGSKAKTLLVQIERLVKTAIESPAPQERAFGSAQRALVALLDEYDQEILEFVKNAIAKEKGEVMNSDAKLAVNREIISAVKGKKLPLVLLQFLQRISNKCLYLTYRRHGMKSSEWRQGVEDIHTLVRSLCIRDRNELFRFYTDEQAQALARVRVGASTIHGDEALAKQFFATLEFIHKQIADGEVPVFKEFTVSGSGDFADASSTAVSDAVHSMPLDDLRVGHWYKLLENGLEVRCRLIEKNLQHGYCLFSNYSGVKAAKRDYTDVVQSARAGTLKQINSAPVFDKALTFACQQIAKKFPKLEIKAQSVEQERVKILAQKRQAEAAENLRRLEDERLREKARLLEEIRIREREERLQQVLSSINRMQPGGRVELIDDDGRKIACKLGLKLKSSGKLIFVDRLGRKVQELLPEHLAEWIVDGRATIANYGVAFDDTLRRLIIDRSE